MVQLVKHDLEFILTQIKVGEANSVAHSGDAAKPLADLVSHHLLPYGLRTVDGSYNNLIPGQEWNGAADQIMPRLLNPKYVPADHRPAGAQGPGSPASAEPTHYGNTGDVWDADPRIISNLISDQSPDNPAIKALIQQGKAHYVYGETTRIEAEDFTDPGAFFEETISGTSGNTVIRLGANQTGAASTTVSSNEASSAFHDIKIAYLDENDGAIPMELWVDGKMVDRWMLDAPNQPGDGAQAANLRTITFENVKIGPSSVVELRATTNTLELARIDYIEMTPKTVMIDNVSADLGDTAPFNGFFTLFGQFFDHGLDLVSKGDNGTVYIPLQPDDPLYVEGSYTNFMVLTRASPVMGAGADGQMGTADDVLLGHRNETTPWIDLNQVYTSNPSHQVFLREYTLVDGKPVATGRMLEGKNGGPATWADVKEQAATKLGILLTDMDVLRVPGLLTDVYGEFVRGPNGFPQLVRQGAPALEGNLDQPVAASEAMSAGRAFLNDIAHNAVPGTYDLNHDGVADGIKAADSDDVAGNPIIPNPMGVNTTYDNELLDRHVIVGDGRGNENIGLTSIHHVFHSEHNRILEETKKIALESGDLAFLNEWLAVDVTQIPTTQAEIDALVWDGERLFQAARFSTEMVYQHLVFEEFARAAAPDVNPFLFSNTTTVSGAIVAEFAHVVYRFGHSMLTETIDMVHIGEDGRPVQSEIGLIEAFLNPLAFGNAGVDPNEAAGAILNGMSRQVGNEIDEFLTGALRNNLVGLPLDLGATNIARARETGVPSLNEARKQFYADTQDTRVKPYESWYDFALSLKNTASVINFIAAYGTHLSITSATTLEAKRAAATLLVMGGNGAPADRLDFLHGQGAYRDTEEGRLGGLNDVDFWIGGLAEKKMTFGSMLGSTFTYVFEYQMEQLQAGDRFYYLSRTQGLNLLNELEADSFAQLIMRNTSLGDGRSTHINGAAFQTADHILEIDRNRQIHDDPQHDDPILGAISPMVIRKDVNGDGIIDYLRYSGTDHVVLGGSNRGETLIGGEGDDTLWGDGGDDYLEGGYGVDHLHGGDGDDIITDSGTDIGAGDVIHGDAGNDVINPGSGLDLVFGGSGQDFIFGGTEAKDINGGLDNDFIRGGTGINFLKGNEGDDWIEGGESFDTLAGDNSELFFNSTIIGHDVLNGRGNDNDYDAESGDDIMFQNEGIERNNGMAGFDWAIHKGHNQAADSDMTVTIFQNQQNNILRDRFDLVEGLSGWKFSDKLTGRDVVMGAFDANGNAAQIGPNAPLESYSNALLEKNVKLIDGLDKLVAHLQRFELTGADGRKQWAVMNTDDASDILLGGGGSDTIKGGGGNDIIDGDKWLNVRIRITVGNQTYTADTLDGKIYREADYVNGVVVAGALAQFGGKTLQQTMFDRTLNPGQLSIVREIVDGNKAGDIDTAVYTDVVGNYTFATNADGSLVISHANFTPPALPEEVNAVSDGTDTLRNIERLQFQGSTLNVITGTAGNDSGPSGQSPSLNGTAQDDIILGLGGNDVLNGNAGNDILLGGAGNDTLNGGAGNDTYSFGLADGNDTINEGSNSGTADRIVIMAGGAALTGLNVSDSDTGTNAGNLVIDFNGQRITVAGHFSGTNVQTGVELINFDNATYEGYALGNGDYVVSKEDPAGPVFGLLPRTIDLSGSTVNNLVAGESGAETIIGGAGNDLIFGSGGNNELNGGAGADLLVAGSGNDQLDGGTGADVMVGGAGNDTYVVDNAGDAVVEAANGGTDEVQTTLGAYTLGANVENLTYTGGGAFTGTGNALNNTITGGTGADTLLGMEGNDRLDGGAGADTMEGGVGNDTYIVDNAGDVVVEAANAGTDTVQASVSYTLRANVENLTLTGNTAINGTGNELANTITGNGAANQLFGGGGNDILNGGGGNDVLDGGSGDDTLDGGSGDDTIIGGAGNDTINLGGGGNDVIAYTAPGFGADVINTFDANAQGGQDRIDLSTLGITAATFTARVGIAAVGGTNNTLLTIRDANGAEIGTIRLNGVAPSAIDQSDFVLAPAAATTITGTTGNNTLNGGNNNDLIDALAGNDMVNGNGGNDTLIGGLGNDTLNGGTGDDTIIWNANAVGGTTDGRDYVNGGTEGGLGDTFVINGNASAETYSIFTRAAWDALPGNNLSSLRGDTEIVITRNGTNNAAIIAELVDIEEIRINGNEPTATGTIGGDTINIVGDFSGTSLRPNTITIDGNAGDDTVDISALTSSHRIVFRSNGGNDTIVGTLRPQDVIELPAGAVPGDYEITTGENGVTTMTRDGHSICFTSVGGLPQFGSGNDDGEGEDDDVSNPGNDDGQVVTPGDDSGSGDDDEEDDDSCGHDGEGAGPGDNRGGTTPPVTQPDTSVGAPIAGTNGTEVLVGTARGETIMALDGNDNVVAGAGNDIVNGGAGNDFLSGEAGRDVMFGGDGDDTMLGGDDADMLYGEAGNDRIFGDAGDDMIDAGAGNDTVYGGAGNDTIVASVNDGNDVYYGDDMTGGTGIDTLDMSAITANITANLGGNGTSYGTVSSSQTGIDTIWGIENIVTGSGNDVITASRAVNVIDGGAGNDVFRFLSAADANGDTILGFQPGDRLDLSAIDANTGAAGKQAFTLANGSSFTGPAQLVISHETRADGEYTVVSGNTTGPDAAEFKISLKGNHDLKPSDFVLS
ncbi:peroxidase family protein [Microvirga sp. TS319]|uniref:peroxidase family protein n=1 Tax=Microvirga sp. TS319 TaxID=3241165 RepID=UPI00351A79C0